MNKLLQIVAVFILALLLPAPAYAAGDPFMGRWLLDKAKSTIANDPGVKSKEIVFAPTPNGGTITETLEMVSSPGQKQVTRLTFVYGKFVLQSEPGLDAFSVVKANDKRVFWTAQSKGKIIARLQVDLSEDGKEMMFRYLFAASDPTGKVTSDRYVYDRQ